MHDVMKCASLYSKLGLALTPLYGKNAKLLLTVTNNSTYISDASKSQFVHVSAIYWTFKPKKDMLK